MWFFSKDKRLILIIKIPENSVSYLPDKKYSDDMIYFYDRKFLLQLWKGLPVNGNLLPAISSLIILNKS